MEENIRDIIISIKNNDNKEIENLLNIFSNIINKFSKHLDGDDTKQDLSIFLITIVKRMQFNSESVYTEKQLLSYISKSLKNEFIRLAVIKSKRSRTEINSEYYIGFDIDYNYNNIEIEDIFRALTNYEKNIIELIFIEGYKVSEVAIKLNKTRQAINQTKNKALKKLRKKI